MDQTTAGNDSKTRGVLLLVSAGLGLGAHAWVSRGVFLALQTGANGTAVERLFVSPPWALLAASVLLAPALLLLVHLALGQLAVRVGSAGPSAFSVEDVAWTKPLLVLWASPLALLAATPRVAPVFTVFAFLLVDARSWWTAIVAAATALAAYRRLAGASGRLSLANVRPLPRFLPATALVAVCAAWVVWGTPHLRFSPVPHGDEPKYLRYCENFYQGHGLEISSIRPIAELPEGFAPRLGRNFRLAAAVLPRELEALAGDIRVFLSDPSHRFARSVKHRGFLRGKNGGVYQVHQPGLSVLMMPAYYIDRRLSTPEPGSDRQWPARLHAVNAFFLGLYLLWVVLIYRFVSKVAGRRWIGWVVALAVGLTMPVAAFPFQFYPELAAGVLLFAVAGHLLFPARPTPPIALAAGLLAGYLPWLHVRFAALAAVLLVLATLKMRREPRRLYAFLCGFAVPVAFLMLYAYRLTGSLLPSAVWTEAGGRVPLSLFRALGGSFAYLLDRQWGLLAHSPVYLLALPGYWLLARQRRDVAWLCALAFLAVLLPSAAHTLHAAATTPNRLIVSVVPIAAVPMAAVIARYARSRTFWAVFTVLLLLSAQNALAYNWSHIKPVGSMMDFSFSGWKVNLLFPARSATPWVTTSNGWLYVAWVAILIALALTPALMRAARGEDEGEERGKRRREKDAALFPSMLRVGAILALVGTIAAAGTGAWDYDNYRTPDAASARRAATLIEGAGGCALCLSSSRGPLDAGAALTVLARVEPSIDTGQTRDPGSDETEQDNERPAGRGTIPPPDGPQ